ncbi:type II toxin-antitoxin system ParD family antitoxin [Argonema galeatum]|uniref:type II toxin-antitoxin system ParD family antitoxin n=1 Tax=Argonema galeatum TaxID=2942762 RepID=UPI0020132AC2|nr:type II toxin-antitoxin system ParD family antitoxin [Argonema galeatum]MCL1468923.1 type II toxin-antitoxin system ParD family antitoxin [Argonema galeatum A003/A1]
MMNITLRAEQEQFIQAEIKKGRYQTAEQLISEALKLLEELNQQRDEIRLEELRQKIAVGTEQIKKGQTTDGEEVFARLQEKLRRDFGVEG